MTEISNGKRTLEVGVSDDFNNVMICEVRNKGGDISINAAP